MQKKQKWVLNLFISKVLTSVSFITCLNDPASGLHECDVCSISQLFLFLSDSGNHVLSPGSRVGNGLTSVTAQELGLPKGIAVAASLIDAHAGGLGILKNMGNSGSFSYISEEKYFIESFHWLYFSLICWKFSCKCYL